MIRELIHDCSMNTGIFSEMTKILIQLFKESV